MAMTAVNQRSLVEADVAKICWWQIL